MGKNRPIIISRDESNSPLIPTGTAASINRYRFGVIYLGTKKCVYIFLPNVTFSYFYDLCLNFKIILCSTYDPPRKCDMTSGLTGVWVSFVNVYTNWSSS